MKRMTGGAAILAMVMSVAPLRVQAQDAPAPTRGPGLVDGPGIEMLMRRREALELSQGQVDRLDQIRQEAVQRRSAHQAQMAELRSRMLAGQMDREELRAAVEAGRAASAQVREQERARVESVLDDAQKQKVEQWRGQARAFRMGRMSGMRDGARGGRDGMRDGRGMRDRRPGMRGGRGMGGRRDRAPGMRGRGFGPEGMAPGMGRSFRRGGGDGDGGVVQPPAAPFERSQARRSPTS